MHHLSWLLWLLTACVCPCQVTHITIFSSRGVNGVGVAWSVGKHDAGSAFHGHQAGARHYFQLMEDESIVAMEVSNAW